MDGTITIGTEIDTKELERQLKQLEKRQSKLADIKAKVEIDLQEYEKQIAKIKQETQNELSQLEIKGLNPLSEQKAKQRILDSEQMQLEALNNQYSQQLQQIKEINAEMQVNESQIDNIKTKLNFKNAFNDIGNSIQKITKKIIRWGIAIFGVHSAYMAVRNAMNVITQNDKQLKADIEYIKTALAYTLEPIIRTIVDLMKTLAQYVAYIVKAWTGRDIFATASKNLKGANKSASQLKKTLAGFDEVNVLSDSSSAGAGGIGTSIKPLEDNDAPIWLKWIATNKDKVIEGLIGIASGLVAVKLGLTGIQGLGLGIALYGVMETIRSIIKFLKDPTFNNFIDILKGIALAVAGVAIMFSAWPVAIGAIFAYISGLLLQNYDKIVGWFNDLSNWIQTNFFDWLHNQVGILAYPIVTAFMFIVDTVQSLFESLFGGVKKVIEGILKLFKGDLKGGLTSILSGFKSILLAPFNAFIAGINALIKGLNKIKIPDWIPGLGGKGINIPLIPKLARGGIVSNPGKGVMMGSYIAGEGQSPEAVLPLNDMTMDRLGEAIARHMTVNLTNVTELDGRTIARKVNEVNVGTNFLLNR